MTYRAFTLLEFLVAMGIFILVGGMALLVSSETYRGSNFHSDRDLLVTALMRARAQSMSNICLGTCTDGEPHGVHIENDTYTVFQGTTYDEDHEQNAVFAANPSVERDPDTLDIVFEQLSGNVSAEVEIELTGGGRTSVITVGEEGQISWTN